MANYKRQLGQIVYHILKNGRPNWDIPHTKAAVFWVKKLSEEEGLTEKEEKILLSAIYLHDIGYSTTQVVAEFESVANAKADHMVSGCEMARQVLKKLNYSGRETSRICEIIRYHDVLGRKRDKLEQLHYEADRLAIMDRRRVKANFNRPDYKKWLDGFKDEQYPLIKTKTGKKYAKSLLEIAEEYYCQDSNWQI